MKILHITKKYPNALGGDAVVVSNLEKQQTESGNSVVILTSNCDEIKNAEHVYKFGLKDTSAALDLITPKRLLSLIHLPFKTLQVIRKERPDIIHTHSVDMAFFISLASRFFGIPIVHTFHSLSFYDERQSALRRKTELPLARWSGAKIFTAPNTADVDQLNTAGLNAALLPNGVDLSDWQSTPDKANQKECTFITVGRIEAEKGVESVVRAAAILQQKTETPFTFLIVGNGSDEARLIELAEELNVSECVRFVGRKSKDEVKNLYNSSQAAILPSFHETTPLTLLEAWAMQLPVISTRVGILKSDTPENVAMIVPIRDPEAIADAAYELIADPAKREQLRNSGTKEVQRFTWSKVCAVAEDIYRSAIK